MKPVFKFFLRLVHCSSGSTLVEMTLIVPVVISLLAGAVDFSMALATQATGGKSVRDAARYVASLPLAAVCPGGVAGWGVSDAKNLAVYGTTSPGNPLPPPLISGWTTSDVDIKWTSGCINSPPTQFNIKVTATFPYTSIILDKLIPIASTYTLYASHEEASIGWLQ
jgi:hypothetical protein